MVWHMNKLRKFKTKLPLFINTVFALVFIFHTSLIGYENLYPDEPSTKTYTKDFSVFDFFPVNFKICVKEQTNSHDRYSKFGYDTIWDFYKGKGRAHENGTWLGWSGHSESNSSLGNVEGK